MSDPLSGAAEKEAGPEEEEEEEGVSNEPHSESKSHPVLDAGAGVGDERLVDVRDEVGPREDNDTYNVSTDMYKQTHVHGVNHKLNRRKGTDIVCLGHTYLRWTIYSCDTN